ncbi:hypothetical protein [Planomonospora sphaerica]|nr:hypothetical protein [Planomonospora sphaerica]
MFGSIAILPVSMVVYSCIRIEQQQAAADFRGTGTTGWRYTCSHP